MYGYTDGFSFSAAELKPTLDIKSLAADPTKMKENLRLRKAPGNVDLVISLHQKTVSTKIEVDTLRNRRNQLADDMKFNRIPGTG
jgi:seryl-tRNA synthetase